MSIKLTQKDIVWSYISIVMSMASNLFLLPFIIYYLDNDMLGLWYVFVSIGTIATLFDFGFAVTFARNITYCWCGAGELKKENVVFVENREPDFHLMKQVLHACKIIYFRIACAALILLLILGTTYIIYISKPITGSIHIYAWIIYAIAISMNLYYGYYTSFLRGVGAVDSANKNTVIARSVQIIVTILMLVLGFGIIGVCTAYLVYGTLFRALGKSEFYRYKDIGKKILAVTKNVTRQDANKLIDIVWHNAWRDGLISISNYFCNQASTLVCSLFLSLTETGVYSIGVQIAMAITIISGTLYIAYQPELQASYINKDVEKVKSIMSLIVMSFIYIFITGTIIFILVFMPLLRLVKPEMIVSLPVLLGLCVYHFVLKFRDFFSSYFSCTNRICYMNGFITSAILCVTLSFIAVGKFHLGVWGLIMSQFISQLVYNAWKWPKEACKEMNLSINEIVRIGTSRMLTTVRDFLKIKTITT